MRRIRKDLPNWKDGLELLADMSVGITVVFVLIFAVAWGIYATLPFILTAISKLTIPLLTPRTTLLLVIAATITSALVSLIGNHLVSNVVYFIVRRGVRPLKQPLLIWVIFYATIIISSVLFALIATADCTSTN